MLYLYSTLELLAVATSNSHFVFCFCNLIIAFLLIGSNSRTSDRPPLTNSSPVNISKEEPIKYQSSAPADDGAAAAELEGVRADQEEEQEQEQEQEDDDDGAAAAELEGVRADQEEEQEQEDDDDELKRRIEQFIDKINREWKAEKLRTGRRYRMKTSYNTLMNVSVSQPVI